MVMTGKSPEQSLDSQISSYVCGLSEKNKMAVLTVVQAMAEAEHDAEFERKWADAIPLDQAFEEVHEYIKRLEWEK
jgi:hypothetical protein